MAVERDMSWDFLRASCRCCPWFQLFLNSPVYMLFPWKCMASGTKDLGVVLNSTVKWVFDFMHIIKLKSQCSSIKGRWRQLLFHQVINYISGPENVLGRIWLQLLFPWNQTSSNGEQGWQILFDQHRLGQYSIFAGTAELVLCLGMMSEFSNVWYVDPDFKQFTTYQTKIGIMKIQDNIING